jgi:hypothetical protein
MSQEHPITPAEDGLVIRQPTGLVSLPEGGSPALAEIISRSLAHIQTSKALGVLYRIGEHELYEPDYRLVCAWAAELGMKPEEVLDALHETRYYNTPDEILRDDSGTLIESGHFVVLDFPYDLLPGASFPEIDGLLIKELSWNDMGPVNIQLFPHLTELSCMSNQLAELDLSGIPNLTILRCADNQLTSIDLTTVSKLTDLTCFDNQLPNLDLSVVPHLITLACQSNQLINLDLSVVPHLTLLFCTENPLLTELDIRPLKYLSRLYYDKDKTRLIQRPDQNFLNEPKHTMDTPRYRNDRFHQTDLCHGSGGAEDAGLGERRRSIPAFAQSRLRDSCRGVAGNWLHP